MNILDTSNLEWKLVAKEKDKIKDKIIAEYSCPTDIVGDMINTFFFQDG